MFINNRKHLSPRYLPILIALVLVGCDQGTTESPPSLDAASAPPPLHEFVELELFSRRIDASADAFKLNEPVGQGGDVVLFAVTPDAERAVYVVGGRERPGEINACRLEDGDPPVRLNPRSSIFDAFTISPDSRRVLWMDREEMLHSGPIDGSKKAVKLDGPCHRSIFWISSDSKWVVYHRADGLCSQTIDGKTKSRRLSVPSQGLPGGVDLFRISANSKWVVFRQDVHTEQGRESGIYSRLIDGTGETIKLSHSLDASYSDIAISADSQRLVFRARESRDRYILYSVPIEGGPPVPLNETIESISGGSPYACKISADSRHVVFQAGDRHALYSRPIDGRGKPVLLCASSYIRYFALSPDGKRVVYLAKRGLDPVTPADLCSRLIDGTDEETKLNTRLPAGVFIWVEFHIGPDSKRVVFRAKASQQTSDYALFSCPINKPEQLVKLSGPAKSWGDVRHFELTPDGRQVLFLARPSGDTEYQVFTRSIDGRGKPIQVSQRLAGESGVAHFKIAPDGRRFLYLGYRVTRQLRARRAAAGGGVSHGSVHVPMRDPRLESSSF